MPECLTASVTGRMNWRPSGSNMTIGAKMKLSPSGGWLSFGETTDTEMSSFWPSAPAGISRRTPSAWSSRIPPLDGIVSATVCLHFENTSSWRRHSFAFATFSNTCECCISRIEGNELVQRRYFSLSNVLMSWSTACQRPSFCSVCAIWSASSSESTDWATFVGLICFRITSYAWRTIALHRSNTSGKSSVYTWKWNSKID